MSISIGTDTQNFTQGIGFLDHFFKSYKLIDRVKKLGIRSIDFYTQGYYTDFRPGYRIFKPIFKKLKTYRPGENSLVQGRYPRFLYLSDIVINFS